MPKVQFSAAISLGHVLSLVCMLISGLWFVFDIQADLEAVQIKIADAERRNATQAQRTEDLERKFTDLMTESIKQQQSLELSVARQEERVGAILTALGRIEASVANLQDRSTAR